MKEQVFEHLARLAAVADLSEENRIAYDKALDRYRVNQIVFHSFFQPGLHPFFHPFFSRFSPHLFVFTPFILLYNLVDPIPI